MTRRPVFWVAYAALSLVALAIAWQLFPLAIPLVNLDVTLARGEAIARAEALAAKLGLAPIDARSAARFAHDSETQNYVELEGGGKAAFGALIAGGLYAPYWWEVRVFKPGEIAEVTIRFRPDGATNGFSRRVPETYVRGATTKALDPAAARALAERRATAEWQVDLAPYAMLEQSQQVRQTGRVDHAFVYERPERLGEARVRLRLAVAGDELVEVAPYVHVPESFERRFRELRSANNTIAGIATVSAGLLYGLGGCVLGVLWLARRHWLVVRPALTAGFVVGALMAAMTLSASPAAWFGFDTAQAASIFWLRQAGRALAVLVAGGLGYALVFMAAESLARRAFPQHPQLWRVWSKDGAATPAVVGRTVGGYLFVPLELALVAAFYYATNRWLGWWQPSEVADRSGHPGAHDPGADADCSLVAGRVHGGVCLSRGAARPRRADWRAFRPSPAGDRDRLRAAGGDLRRGARQLSGVSRVFAAGRTLRCLRSPGRRSSCGTGSCRRSSCMPCSTSRCSRSRSTSSTRRARGRSVPR